MRISYLFVALSLLLVFGVAYALAAEGEDTVLYANVADEDLVDDVVAEEDAIVLEDGELGLYGEEGDPAAAADATPSGPDHLKRSHDNTTDLGGCGY